MSLPQPYYQDDAVVIYHADCRAILPELGPVDAVVTDPPYGIGCDYASYDDSAANLDALLVDAIPLFMHAASVIALTPGVANVHRYPAPKWILAWFWSGGGGSGPWGFSQWQPVLVYGPDPYLKNGLGRRPDAINVQATPDSVDHPCPKPNAVMRWLVDRVSMPGNFVLDPLMGSGTTLRAAKDLGRKAIGIEIEERYCEIAAKRMAQEVLPL